MAKRLRILAVDVETAPRLAFLWRLQNDYVSWKQLEQDLFVLCWAASWMDRQGIRGAALTAEEARQQNDRRIIEELRNLVEKADILVGHNIDQFDLPIIRSRVAFHGLDPLPRLSTIDTLKLARRAFGPGFASTSMGYLAEKLALPQQKQKLDFDLWRGAYRGEEAALNKLLKYCRQDVRVQKALFERLEPYAPTLPTLIQPESFDEQGRPLCPFCGGEAIKWGVRYNRSQAYQRWKCKDCARISRSRYALKTHRTLLTPE